MKNLKYDCFLPENIKVYCIYIFDMHDQFALSRKLFGDVAEDIVEARNFDISDILSADLR